MNMKNYCTCMHFQPNSFTGNCIICNYPKKKLDSKIDLQGFKPPKTSTQEVLLHLIIFGYVSIEDFSKLSGFRTRVSNLILDHGLFLEREWIFAFNKFGNQIKYAKHYLPESEKPKAVAIYKKLNSN